MDFPSWHTCSAAICNWDNSGDLQAYIFTFTCIWCVCVATVILFLAFFVFLFFYSFIHLRVGEPLSMNQVCNTALCVMKEASVSPAQDVCNYWDFRKTAYNNEVKKNPRLDFVTSHHPPYTDIWVLSPECCHQTAVKATGGRGRGELWGGCLLQHRRMPPWSTWLTRASHTPRPHYDHLRAWGRLPAATWSPLHPAGYKVRGATVKYIIHRRATEGEDGDFILAVLPRVQANHCFSAPSEGKRPASDMGSWALLVLKVTWLIERRWKTLWITMLETEMT